MSKEDVTLLEDYLYSPDHPAAGLDSAVFSALADVSRDGAVTEFDKQVLRNLIAQPEQRFISAVVWQPEVVQAGLNNIYVRLYNSYEPAVHSWTFAVNVYHDYKAVLVGDFSADGFVDKGEENIFARLAAGEEISGVDLRIADVNGDGVVGPDDSSFLNWNLSVQGGQIQNAPYHCALAKIPNSSAIVASDLNGNQITQFDEVMTVFSAIVFAGWITDDQRDVADVDDDGELTYNDIVYAIQNVLDLVGGAEWCKPVKPFLSVALDPEMPVPDHVVAGDQGVEVLRFRLSANSTRNVGVIGLALEGYGFGCPFFSFSVLNGDQPFGAGLLDDNCRAEVPLQLIVPGGGFMIVRVLADLKPDAAGQFTQVGLAGIETNARVEGLPVIGPEIRLCLAESECPADQPCPEGCICYPDGGQVCQPSPMMY